jgi:hypothetical protein
MNWNNMEGNGRGLIYGTIQNLPGGIEVNLKQSRYTPWRRLEREDAQLLLINDLGTRWG